MCGLHKTDVYKRQELKALVSAIQGEPGDLLLFAADKNKIVWNVLGALRLELAKELDLLDPDPVSYTHLDVYKRQVENWCFITTWILII